MRAVVTVIGKDREGIIARISGALYDFDVNVLDIRQNVMDDIFAMIMLVDLGRSKAPLPELSAALEAAGEAMGTKVIIMHEDVFNAMHRI